MSSCTCALLGVRDRLDSGALLKGSRDHLQRQLPHVELFLVQAVKLLSHGRVSAAKMQIFRLQAQHLAMGGVLAALLRVRLSLPGALPATIRLAVCISALRLLRAVFPKA